MFPVRQAELRLVEGVLAVDPAGEAVADERRIHEFEEPILLSGVLRDERGDEPRAVAVEPVDGLIGRRDDGERDLGALLPLPLGPKPALRDRFGLSFFVFTVGSGDRDPAGEPGLRDGTDRRLEDMELRLDSSPLAGPFEGVEEHRHEIVRSLRNDAACIEGVADLAVERVIHRGSRTPRCRPALRQRSRRRRFRAG